MAIQAAFMQSDKPPKCQKEITEKLWDRFCETRKSKLNKELAQSRELKECPEKFGDEDFLEEFVVQNHYGWGVPLKQF